MRKYSQESYHGVNENLNLDEIKTTNINILLNRVKSEEKKIFFKRLIIAFSLTTILGIIGLFTIFN
tara:strand:- start:985 stop:1182 length:198 start_codon:yes stop_codon:yes gene_type:complete